MSFPPFGEKSAAYNATFSVDGINVPIDILVGVKGQVVMIFLEGDIGSVEPHRAATDCEYRRRKGSFWQPEQGFGELGHRRLILGSEG